MRLAFDDYVIDTEAYELRRSGARCHVEPKVFDLIVHLTGHPGQVFSHEQLIDAVWDGRFVSESTVSTCIKSARKALGDSGNTQRYIKTMRGRGFRFDADVRQAGESLAPAAQASGPQITTPALLIRTFRVLAKEPDTLQLAGAFADDLGRILTRMPLLRIRVQPNSGVSGEIGPTPRELHESTGVDFVLDGALQRLGGRYRINIQLLDARSGFQLWSEQIHVDGPLDRALDDAPIALISRLEPQLQRAIYDAVRSASGAPNSRQLFLEAAGVMVFNGWGHKGFSQAAELLRRSRGLEPDFALAHAFLSLVMGFGDRVGLMADRDRAKAESLEAAERALELDSMDSTVLGYAGCAIADVGQREPADPRTCNRDQSVECAGLGGVGLSARVRWSRRTRYRGTRAWHRHQSAGQSPVSLGDDPDDGPRPSGAAGRGGSRRPAGVPARSSLLPAARRARRCASARRGHEGVRCCVA